MNDIEANNLVLLTNALAALETPEEAQGFLYELCTHKEIRILAQRAGIAELLIHQISYRNVGEMLGYPSTATINRVSEIVKNGDGILGRVIMRSSGAQGK